MLPKIESWRDTEDTHYRKNHQEEAKLWLLNTPTPCRTSPLYVKQRNRRAPTPLQDTSAPTAWEDTNDKVLPKTTLGQISLAPWTDPNAQKKEKLNKKQWQKRHVAKREGHPEHWRGGGAIPHGTVNKQASWRRQEKQHTPSNQEWESL
jgi:hypothetical protein